MRLRDLAVNQRIVESNPGGVGIGIGEVDFGKAGPVDGPQTHGAGFTGSVDLAALQIEHAKLLAGRTDGEHLRMRGGIIRGGNLVGGFGDDGAVFHDDRAEGSAAS